MFIILHERVGDSVTEHAVNTDHISRFFPNGAGTQVTVVGLGVPLYVTEGFDWVFAHVTAARFTDADKATIPAATPQSTKPD